MTTATPENPAAHARAFGAGLTVLTCVSLSGCASLWNPYLDSTALSKPLCSEGQACSVEDRFQGMRNAVAQAQTSAHSGVTDRAYVETVSSALAFPAAGYLIFRGAAAGGALGNVQKRQLLGAGLGMAALYETRETLLSGSPEGIYLQAEARLACVVNEADRYTVDYPAQTASTDQARAAARTDCDAQSSALQAGLQDVRLLQQNKKDLTDPLGLQLPDIIAAAQKALDDYASTPASLQDAVYAMRGAANRIVVDTNGQLKLPGVSPATATPLLQSALTQVTAVSAKIPTASTQQAAGGAGDNDRTVVKLSESTTAFIGHCLRPHPATSGGFGSCTTYSITAAPLPTMTTTLSGNAASLAPGKSLSFLATSSPTGQPWATVLGDVSSAQAAIEQVQQQTISPNQTQVTVNYKNAVAVDTPLTLSIAPMGTSAAAVTVTVTLLAKAAPNGAAQTGGTQVGVAGTPPLSAVQQAVIMKIGADKIPGFDKATDIASRVDVLGTAWRAQCTPAAGVTPSADQLTDTRFLNSLMQPPAPAAKPWCKSAT